MLLLAEPPANGNFMVAAYAIVAVVLCGYSLRLLRRASALERER
jgi:CcmD family protein